MARTLMPIPLELTPRPVSRLISPEQMDERKQAFELWLDDPKHSYKKVAEDLDKSEETIRRWSREDDWKGAFMSSSFALPRDYVKKRGEDILDSALTRLSSIVDHGSDSDANTAIKTILSILVNDKGDVNVTVNDNSRTLMMGNEIKSVEDINRYLSLKAEGNIIDVESRRRN